MDKDTGATPDARDIAGEQPDTRFYFSQRVNHTRRPTPKAWPARCVAALFAALISGCASSVAVQRAQPTDDGLSCEQIASAVQEADKFRADAQNHKGVTGTNTAAALFFWPALFLTYSDANSAIQAADARKAHLLEIRTKKGCS